MNGVPSDPPPESLLKVAVGLIFVAFAILLIYASST